MNKSTAYIALGANLGDRRFSFDRAIDLLRRTPHLQIIKVSSFHETEAVGGPPGSPDFLNAAVAVETTLEPWQLLARLLEIEQVLGRERRVKWGPRVIDLDLLLYDDQVIDQPHLQVPHPLMHTRGFVLQPLAEIAPQARHPVFGQSISELLSLLSSGHGG